jgi:hypothetical protein
MSRNTFIAPLTGLAREHVLAQLRSQVLELELRYQQALADYERSKQPLRKVKTLYKLDEKKEKVVDKVQETLQERAGDLRYLQLASRTYDKLSAIKERLARLDPEAYANQSSETQVTSSPPPTIATQPPRDAGEVVQEKQDAPPSTVVIAEVPRSTTIAPEPSPNQASSPQPASVQPKGGKRPPRLPPLEPEFLPRPSGGGTLRRLEPSSGLPSMKLTYYDRG